MNAERTIHAAIFVLLLVGLSIVSAWASYTYISNGILKIAGITLGWGIILLLLYVVFRGINWRWWS